MDQRQLWLVSEQLALFSSIFFLWFCLSNFCNFFLLSSSSRNIFSTTWFNGNCNWLRYNKRWQRRSKFSSSHRRRQRPHQLRVQGQELHLCWQGEHDLGFEPFFTFALWRLFLYSGLKVKAAQNNHHHHHFHDQLHYHRWTRTWSAQASPKVARMLANVTQEVFVYIAYNSVCLNCI